MKDPLHGLSLSHLRTLDALLETGSVTQTAARLEVTQSAVSHALRTLRDSLGDPLFVRSKGGMVPTARAMALQVPLHRALGGLRDALEPATAFDPATSTRTFRLSMPDSFAPFVVGQLLSALQSEAPGIDLEVRPPKRHGQDLINGEADLGVVVGQLGGAGLRRRFLFESRLMSALWAGNEAVGRHLDLETYCRLPHALLSPDGSGPGAVDEALAKLGRTRCVQLRINFFLAAPFILVGTPMILTGPELLLKAYARIAPLRVLEAPVSLPTFRTYLYWHERVHREPAHQWLRARIIELSTAPFGVDETPGTLMPSR